MPGVDGGPDAGVEQIRLEEDLAVGDRDHVSRHECGHVAGLRLDDRQRRQRAGLALDRPLRELFDVVRIDPRRALEQSRVQVEHVARIRFAARRTAQQQRDLAIGPRLLGQVVVDDQRVLATIAEVLAHRAAGIRRDVLHRRRFGRRGGHDDRVVHRAEFLELAQDVGDVRGLLPDRDVHADQVLALLVDDRVDRHRSLAGLAVTDDQFALAAADRHHRVDGLQARLHWLRHRLPLDHARSDLFNDVRHLRVDRAFAVDRLAERVDDAPDQLRADRHIQDAAGRLDGSPSRMCS